MAVLILGLLYFIGREDELEGLTREITETSAGPMWTIEGDSVPVDSGGANDVCLPIFKGFDYPSCPQCAIEGLAFLG